MSPLAHQHDDAVTYLGGVRFENQQSTAFDEHCSRHSTKLSRCSTRKPAMRQATVGLQRGLDGRPVDSNILAEVGVASMGSRNL